MRIVWILLVGLTLLGPQRANAWNDTGHMLVAEIAYRRLNDNAKARIDALLALDARPESRTFVMASCWPDDLKQLDVHAYDTWHYTDNPFSPDGTPTPAKPPETNILWAMNQCVRTLKSHRASDAEKARMLRYLIHFVGDVHQPLHCVSRYTQAHPKGDRGGNDFKLVGVAHARNLHAYWDGGCGQFEEVSRPLPEDEQPIREQAESIMADFPAEQLPEWQNHAFRDWTEEGSTLARTLCYDLNENAAPPEAYVTKARPAARKRIALAGYRLADLLNRLFS